MKNHRYQRNIVQRSISLFLVIIFVIAQGLLISFASSAPSVDPETTRMYSYAGSDRVGLWLNLFDEEGKCRGNTYAIFNAGSSFNQFGFPTIWAGREENGQAAELKVEIFSFDETPERSFKAEPLFSETIYQNGDNSYGAIFPMGKTLPSGKYILSCSQITDSIDGSNPYIVIPTGTPSRTTDFISYGGTPDGIICFFIDFIKDETVKDYFLPVGSSSGLNLIADEPVTVFQNTSSLEARRLNPGDTFAVLTAEIPEEKILYTLTFVSMPTWSNNGPGSNLAFDVYKWDTNYTKTVSSDPVYSGEVLDHRDNTPLELYFGYSLTGGVKYLIVTRASGSAPIGFWISEGEMYDSKWRAYYDGKGATGEPLPGFYYTTAKIEYVEIPTGEHNDDNTPSPQKEKPTPKDQANNNEADGPAQKTTGCGSTVISALACFLPFAVIVFMKKKR